MTELSRIPNPESRIPALSPIREFGLKALLWLPLCFVLWFALAPVWVQPSIAIARVILLHAWGDLFAAVTQGGDLLDAGGRVVAHAGHLVQLTTKVLVTVPAGPSGPGGVGVLEPTLNPMVYGYSLPLFGGLAMATPLSSRRLLLQLAIAFCVIWLAQAGGIVAESLKVVAFNSGTEGAAAAARAGLTPEIVAFAYQFGYLILPAVVPIALWIGLNRAFIEHLVRPDGEPGAGNRGQTDA